MKFMTSLHRSVLGLTLVSLSFLAGCGRDSFYPNLKINPPVSQPLTFTAPIFMDWSQAAMPVPNLQASPSCPPSAVTITIATNDWDKTVTPGATMASWSPDPTHLTYGTINRGSTISVHSFATYIVTAICGTSSDSTQLTMVIKAPTITSVSPKYCKSYYCIVDVYGSYFVGTNYLTWGGSYTEYGTSAYYYSSTPCTPNWGFYFGGPFKWISDTHIQINVGGEVGDNRLNLINDPSADVGGGGTACQDKAFASVSPISNYASAHDISVMTWAQDGAFAIFRESTNTLLLNGLVGSGMFAPIVTADAVYAPSIANQGVVKIDLQTLAVSFISIPGYNATMVAAIPGGGVYALARYAGDQEYASLFRVDSGTAFDVASADGYTSIETTGGRIFWTVPGQDRATSLVYGYNEATFKVDTINALSVPADSLVALNGGGLLAYHIGDTQAAYLDAHTYQQDGIVTAPAGLLLANRGLVTLQSGELVAVASLTNGNIVSLTVTAPNGTLSLNTTVLQNIPMPEQLYRGFSFEYLSTGSSLLTYAKPGSPVAAAIPRIPIPKS